jgi:hypothetical protein
MGVRVGIGVESGIRCQTVVFKDFIAERSMVLCKACVCFDFQQKLRENLESSAKSQDSLSGELNASINETSAVRATSTLSSAVFISRHK